MYTKEEIDLAIKIYLKLKSVRGAIQVGELSRVAPIDKLSVVITMGLAFLLLGETPSWNVLFGGLLIAAGSILMLVK